MPIDDKTLTISIPVDLNNIRGIITKEESEKLIKSIPTIEIIKVNDKLMEN